MAFPSPPPPYSSALLFLLFLLAASAATAADSPTKAQEFEDMLQSLRNYGYSLFTNGIATSDLKYELLAAAAAAATNFTLFAPTDELLYALDMATDAAIYVSTLRYHVVPNRHTFADLKNLSAPFLDTLLPDYAVLIGKVRDVDVSTDRASIGLIVDGVRIAYPDLFVGSRIAVHGIDGILLTGLNMSRDLGGDYDGSGHNPPLGSPAPVFEAIPAPAPASALDRNIPIASPPNNVNIPAEGTQTPNPPTPPASPFIRHIPAMGTQTPNSPTPPASSFIGIIPAKGMQRPNAPPPPASSFSGNIPAQGNPTPNARNPPAFSFSGNIPASNIDRNDVPAATVASHFDWGATPTISQEQIERMKRLGMNLPGIGVRKGRRRYRRRIALGDL